MPTFDHVIKHGKIYDGSLQAPFIADIGICDDKIAHIGRIRDTDARVVDATDCIVAPGFIDVHNHTDEIFKDATFKHRSDSEWTELAHNASSLRQGVTSIITGNCGMGFSHSADWFQVIQQNEFPQNVGTLIPHGDLRKELFGDEQPKHLSPEQLKMMQTRVAEEMEKGALGMSTGLAYAPGYHSTTEELIELSKTVARCGGLYATHMRSESGLGILDAIDETITIAREANIPAHISHLKLTCPYGNVQIADILEHIESARNAGIDITADQYPYEASFTHLAYLLPLQYQAPSGVQEKFYSQAGKAKLRAETKIIFKETVSPDKIILAARLPHPDYVGKSIQEISAFEKRDPAELYVDLVCTPRAPTALFFLTTEQMAKEIMCNHYVLTASDSWTVPYRVDHPHPRFYGTFIKKIKQYALDEKWIDLSFAIRSMTALPAEKFQLHGRGMIAKNYFADLVIFDPQTLSAPASYNNPHQYAKGIRAVLVNGKIAYSSTQRNIKGNGQILRAF